MDILLFTKRTLAIFKARNLEFVRDRASLGWSLLFPILLLVGFAFVFSGDGKSMYKVGVINPASVNAEFLNTKYIEFVNYSGVDQALDKVRKHKLDLLVDYKQRLYWLNDTSANGYILEQLLVAHQQTEGHWQRSAVSGEQIRYLDWVVPGILGMNMMFSCLFGVGYVIVRYRKNMVLKRLNATPVSALEFLTAQILSRLVIVLTIASAIFIGCDLMFDFYFLGRAIDLLFVAVLGAMSLISLGLLVASRSESEELTGGLLNLVSWPMMLLSGVWFSLEGSPSFIQQMAQFLPLTHLVEGARRIMTDGASLLEIQYHLWSLLAMTLFCLIAGSLSFKWQGQGR